MDAEEKLADENSPKKESLQIEKLKLDIEIARKQFKYFHKYQTLELFKLILPFLTVIATILGFYFTFQSQQKQLFLFQKQHSEDAFAKDIQQLAFATNETSKIVAISKLSTYFKNRDSIIDAQIINLLMGYAESDSSENIKVFISKELCNNRAGKLLPILAEQNKMIQASFPYSDEHSYYNSDQYEKISQTLNWNINTIIECFKHLKEVNNLDFSGLILNRPLKVFQLPEGGFKPHMILNNNLTNINIRNIKFNNISFSNALLDYLNFENVEFKNVSFDSSSLARVEFNKCYFSRCSFDRFTWGARIFNDNDSHEIFKEEAIKVWKDGFYHPVWNHCTLDLINFSPQCPEMDVKLKMGPRGFFSYSKWKIDTIYSTSRPCCKLEKFGNE